MGGTRESRGEAADSDGRDIGPARVIDVAQPEVAHAIAVAVVPFVPAVAEVAGLPAPHSDIPRLGDLLHACQSRIGDDPPEQGMVRGEGVGGVAAQGGGEIEAEAVDLHVLRPVSERVQHETGGGVRCGVQRVPAPGDVDVGAVVLLPVVVAVVQTAQARAGSAETFFAGVVVDDVEDDLDARLVQELHHSLHLAQDRVRASATVLLGRVRGVGGEEVQRVVAPVVGQPVLQEPRFRGECMNGQQLQRGHPEPLEVLDHRRMREACIRAVQRGRHSRVALGESLHVTFVDHGAIHGGERLRDASPVEAPIHHDRPPVLVPVTGGQAPGVRFDEQRATVEGGPRRAWAVRAHGISRTRPQQIAAHAPHAVADRFQRDVRDAPVEIGVIEDHEVDPTRVLGPHAEGAAAVVQGDSQIVESVRGKSRRGRGGGRGGHAI